VHEDTNWFRLNATTNNTVRKRLLRKGELLTYLLVYFLADICKNYQTLTDAERKSDYVTVSSKCDRTLNGWYRFIGAAGTKMLTTCPPMGRCGANFPAWLSEDHPTVAEGIVTRKVCIHEFTLCCNSQFYIEVKNCTSYFIYKLTDPWGWGCSVRYCGAD